MKEVKPSHTEYLLDSLVWQSTEDGFIIISSQCNGFSSYSEDLREGNQV